MADSPVAPTVPPSLYHAADVTNTQPTHYVRLPEGVVRRITPKLRGKAAVKAAKRAKQATRRG